MTTAVVVAGGRKRGKITEEEKLWEALSDAIRVDTTAFAVDTPLRRKSVPDCRVSEAAHGEHDNEGRPFDVMVTVPENFLRTRLLEVAVYRRRYKLPLHDKLFDAGVDEPGISKAERKKRRDTVPGWDDFPQKDVDPNMCGKDALRDKRLEDAVGKEEEDGEEECTKIKVGDKPPSYVAENVRRIFYGYGEDDRPSECPKDIDFWSLSCTVLLELAPDENDEGRVTCILIFSGVASFKLDGPVTSTTATGRPKNRRVSGGGSSRRARSPSPVSRGKRKASPEKTTTTIPAETVVRYVSKVGNNDVPYHFLVTERNVYFTSCGSVMGSIPLDRAEKLGFTAARGGDAFALCPDIDVPDLEKKPYFTPREWTQLLPRGLAFDR